MRMTVRPWPTSSVMRLKISISVPVTSSSQLAHSGQLEEGLFQVGFLPAQLADLDTRADEGGVDPGRLSGIVINVRSCLAEHGREVPTGLLGRPGDDAHAAPGCPPSPEIESHPAPEPQGRYRSGGIRPKSGRTAQRRNHSSDP